MIVDSGRILADPPLLEARSSASARAHDCRSPARTSGMFAQPRLPDPQITSRSATRAPSAELSLRYRFRFPRYLRSVGAFCSVRSSSRPMQLALLTFGQPASSSLSVSFTSLIDEAAPATKALILTRPSTGLARFVVEGGDMSLFRPDLPANHQISEPHYYAPHRVNVHAVLQTPPSGATGDTAGSCRPRQHRSGTNRPSVKHRCVACAVGFPVIGATGRAFRGSHVHGCRQKLKHPEQRR